MNIFFLVVGASKQMQLFTTIKEVRREKGELGATLATCTDVTLACNQSQPYIIYVPANVR